MKLQRAQEGAGGHLLAKTPSRHDADGHQGVHDVLGRGGRGGPAAGGGARGAPGPPANAGAARGGQGGVRLRAPGRASSSRAPSSGSCGRWRPRRRRGTGTSTTATDTITTTFACLIFTSPGALGRRTSLLRIHVERAQVAKKFSFSFLFGSGKISVFFFLYNQVNFPRQ